jgi:glycosyltransferase involved in cell wall biosynthesis
MDALAMRRRRSRSALMMARVAIICLGLAGIIAAYGFISADALVLRTWLSSLLALGVIWGYVFQRYGGTIPLRTDVLVMLGFSLNHLLPPLYLSLRVLNEPSVDMWGVADMYPLVALVTTIGALAFLFGYGVVGCRSKAWELVNPPSVRLRLSHPISVIILLILIVVWVARIILLVNGAYYWVYMEKVFMFGKWYSVTSQISYYGLIVPILMWLLVDRNPRWQLWAWLTTTAELSWILPSGARGEILMTLFGLLLVAWWRSRRLPKGKIVALLVVVVIMMPILGEYRYMIGRFTATSQISVSATIKATQAAFDRFVLSSGGTLLAWVDPFAQRLFDGQYLGYLLKHYHQVYDWEYGRTYFTRVPFLFLPYFIFPDRPIMQVPIDHWFKLVAGGSAPSTFLGEAFINFSYVGIPIVAFLMGIILGAYDTAFRRRQNDIFIVAIYLLVGTRLPFMVTQSLASWLAFLRNAVLMALAFYLMVRFMRQFTVKTVNPLAIPRMSRQDMYQAKPTKSARNIAIVVPDLMTGHGWVPTVSALLYRVIEDSGRYMPHLISLATSSRDRFSIRLLSPVSWFKGLQIARGCWRGIEYRHVGCKLAELEFQRYKPRKELTALLSKFDLVQVVAGTPAWAYVTLPLERPVALQVATLISIERKARLATEAGLRSLWLKLMTRINRRMELSVLHNMDAVFVENQWMYDRLCTIVPEGRVYFAPPGVDTEFFRPGVYQADGYILSVGRFSDPRKNIRLLLDAYASLVQTSPSTPDLVLVGEAPSALDMAYIAALGLANRIHVFTDVTQDELAQYYRGARMFVLSSDEEGLGLAILEAMASGLAVVSTDCGGPATSVLHGVTGFLTPVGNAAALAAAMECLLTDPHLTRRMGEAGRQRAVDRFSVKVTGKLFLETYDKLLGL